MKVFLGSIVYRQIDVANHSSILRLYEYTTQQGIELIGGTVSGDADVGRARSVAATNFLMHSDADVMLTVDSDIYFRAEDAIKIARLAVDGLDVVGALYATRSGAAGQPALLFENGQTVEMSPTSPPVSVKFLASGFMAISRKVMERVIKQRDPILNKCLPLTMQASTLPFYPFYLQGVIPWPRDKWIYLSEDWAFCYRARAAGFKIWLDPSIRLGHVGTHIYRLEDILYQEVFKSPALPLRMTLTDGQLLTEVITDNKEKVEHAIPSS